MTNSKRGGRRRGIGTGSLFKQHGSKRWSIQYFKNGRRIRESTGFSDLAAAQQRLSIQLAAVATGTHVERDRKPILVSELYEMIERDYRQNARRTLDKLQRTWTLHLSGVFGDMAGQNVDSEQIDLYVDARLRAGAANASVNRELAALKRMFRIGYGKQRLTRIPMFPHLEENNRRIGFVEDADYRQLTSHASELWLRLFLELGYTYGWRKQELLKLRTRQIDLAWKTIRLDVGSTKNGDGRQVSMTATVLGLMQQAVAGKGKDDYVLTRADGKPVGDFRKMWRNLCVRAGLGSYVCRACAEPVTGKKCECGSQDRKYCGLIPHDFRRSAARNLRRAGVAESVVMNIGGWKTRKMFDRYAIVSDADNMAAVEKLEQSRRENSHSFSHSPAPTARPQGKPVTARPN
jgi:integrase